MIDDLCATTREEDGCSECDERYEAVCEGCRVVALCRDHAGEGFAAHGGKVLCRSCVDDLA